MRSLELLAAPCFKLLIPTCSFEPFPDSFECFEYNNDMFGNKANCFNPLIKKAS